MKRMQKKIMSSTGAIILAAACLVTTACSRRDPAPYEVSSGTLQMGSLYYAQAGWTMPGPACTVSPALTHRSRSSANTALLSLRPSKHPGSV